jgi:4-diphosphocytidyl-2-C-methyl-D-erythritol kinase
MPIPAARFAPAKVNLFLHVGAPGDDGFHPVCSLMVFADVGDEVRLAPGEAGLRIEGPFAAGLAGEGDNLVLRARDALLAQGGRPADFGLVLAKGLPIASGLGGGSSDAAATLRLIRDALALDLDDAALRAIAATLGSDTPACIDASPVIATGRGDVLATAPPLPTLPAVLVNPGVPSPTGAVYRAYDRAVAPEGANAPAWPDALACVQDVARFLGECRNDLEAPALASAPPIGEALRLLSAQPEVLIARMSGSGATCFALCPEPEAASRLASRLAADQPGWWVRACALGGGPARA